MRSGDIRKKNVLQYMKNRILPLRCGSANASYKYMYDVQLASISVGSARVCVCMCVFVPVSP